jgi:hypothetical protein
LKLRPECFTEFFPRGTEVASDELQFREYAVRVNWSAGRMKQIIRELKRQVAGEMLEPEQLKGLIRAGYVYRNGDEHLLTDQGRDALAQPGVYPTVAQ